MFVVRVTAMPGMCVYFALYLSVLFTLFVCVSTDIAGPTFCAWFHVSFHHVDLLHLVHVYILSAALCLPCFVIVSCNQRLFTDCYFLLLCDPCPLVLV